MVSILKRMVARPNIAIDLGNANTRIYSCESGMIAEEPSLVRRVPPNTVAKDQDALLSYLNSRFVSFPLRGGVVVDADAAVSLLKPLFKRARKTLRHPVSLACAPTDASEAERRRLAESVLHAGAARVAIVPEPLAAAIGAGMDTSLPHSQLLIDIGDGVTDLAVVRDGRLFLTSAVRTACSDIHKALRSEVLARHRVCLYPAEVEHLVCQIDVSCPAEDLLGKKNPAKGIDIRKRGEVSLDVGLDEACTVVGPIISKILKMIRAALKKLPENIHGEILDSGICLTGGGSCIKGMDRLIALETGLNTRIAPDPVHAVINGAIQTLEFWKEKESWWENFAWPLSTNVNRPRT